MSRPFVHLFTTSLGYYCYDVNTGQICEVDKETYDYLNENSDTVDVNSTPEAISRMVDAGLLKDNHVQNILHPYTELLPYALESKIHMLILQVTQNCNLRCDYCVYSGNYKTRVHQNKRMSADTAKRAIDFLRDHSTEKEKVFIGFYGGEPLLEFDLIKACVEYAEIIMPDKTVEFSITTNGTLLSEKYIDWMVRKNFSITVSLDGPKEVHDRSRIFADTSIGSFDIIMSNLSIIQCKYPDFYQTNVHFSTVLSTEYSFSCADTYFKEDELLKSSPISFSEISSSFRKNELQISDNYVCEEQFELFKLLLSLFGRVRPDTTSPLLKEYIRHISYFHKKIEQNLRSEMPETWHRGGPCIPGITRLFITADGSILPCEKVCETAEACRIGSLDEGFDVDKITNLLNIEKITSEECHNCWAYTECLNCARKFDDDPTNNRHNILNNCSSVRRQVDETLKDYTVLKKLGYSFSERTDADNLTDNIRAVINTPVVFLANMFVGMDDFAVECANNLRDQFEGIGYNALAIDGRNLITEDTCISKAITGINHEVLSIENSNNPDVIFIAVPGNCIEISKMFCGDGGTYLHLFSQAVPPDYIVMNVPYSMQLVREARALCEGVSNSGAEVGCINVIPFYLDIEISEEEDRLDFLSLSADFVQSRISCHENIYCSHDTGGIRQLATQIIEVLSGFAGIDPDTPSTTNGDNVCIQADTYGYSGMLENIFRELNLSQCIADGNRDEPFFGSTIRMRARDLLAVFFFIEERYGITINEDDITVGNFRSFSSLKDYISQCVAK